MGAMSEAGRIEPKRPVAARDEAEVILSARGIRVAFGDHVVLDGLSLDIRRGEILGFVGASGSGKSVLLRAILGITKKQAGTISLFGVDLDTAVPEAYREPLTRIEATPLHAHVPLPPPLGTEPVVRLVVCPRVAARLEERPGDSLTARQKLERVRGVHCERVPVLEIEGDLTAAVPALDVPRPIVLEIVDVSLETHLPDPRNRRGPRAENKKQ